MSIFGGRPEPGEIFTPRRSDVNRDMYVSRPDLERKLRRAVRGTQHIIVFGDSGSGKTWLYKEYFERNSINYLTVDLSTAVLEGLQQSLAKAVPDEDWIEIKKTEGAAVGANYIMARAQEKRVTEFRKTEKAPLDVLMKKLRSKSGSKTAFLVFDNFEQVSQNPGILKDIGSLIIRLDNSNFSKKNVRFLFVGVVSDMKELIAHYNQVGTVSNRVTEIPEVQALSISEANSLIRRGLFEKLKIEYDGDIESLCDRIRFLTGCNAQQLHELCYQIACESEENEWRLSAKDLCRAEKDWADTSLSQYTALVEARMNKRETRIQRRNQVLFCLGAIESNSIKASDIDAMVRKFFPDKLSAKQLGIDQILMSLAEGMNPILISNPNDSTYRISHPKLRLAIRYRLEDFAPKTRRSEGDALREFTELMETIRKNLDSLAIR